MQMFLFSERVRAGIQNTPVNGNVCVAMNFRIMDLLEYYISDETTPLVVSVNCVLL